MKYIVFAQIALSKNKDKKRRYISRDFNARISGNNNLDFVQKFLEDVSYQL